MQIAYHFPNRCGRERHLQPFSMTYKTALMKTMLGIRTFRR